MCDYLKNQTVNCRNVGNKLQLSCMYFNARSLFNKISLLSAYALSNHPDLIAITETWANTDTPDGFYSLPGYTLYRADRTDKRGGGVMLFVSEAIASSEVSCTHYDDFEASCIKLPLNSGKYAGFLCIYRPPNITTVGDLQIIELINYFMELNHT